MVGSDSFILLEDENRRRWVYEAMQSAVPKEVLAKPDAVADRGYPWITFVAFHYREPELPEEILNFVQEMVNREDILRLIISRDFEKASYRFACPFP